MSRPLAGLCHNACFANGSANGSCRLLNTHRPNKDKGRLAAKPPFVAANISHSIPIDRRLDCSYSSPGCCRAQGRAAAAEVPPHAYRTDQCRPGASNTMIHSLRLHRRRVPCISVPGVHNPARMKVLCRRVRSTRRQAPHKSGNRFRPQHERWQTRCRRLPARRKQIETRLPKLAMTTQGQAQGQRCRIS